MLLSAERDRLSDAVDRRLDETNDLLQRLVAEPSTEGSAAISRCLDLVAAVVTLLATAMDRPAHDGLESLIARFGQGPAARRLNFAGHVDVVPAEGAWTTTPFESVQADGRVVGRGTCDMKGGVAAFAAALRVLADVGLLARCAVELVLTGDEEVGSRRGMIARVERGLVSGQWAICGEPTGLDVYLGNRGLVWLEIVVRGRGGHAGLAHALYNPVPIAAQLVAALHDLVLTVVDERFDPSRPSLNVTRIDAGAAMNALDVIPDAVTIGVDRRLLPGEDPDAAIVAIRTVVDDMVRPPFSAEIAPLQTWPPYAIAADEPLAMAARDAVRHTGRAGHIGMDLAANDSSWLDRAGIPTVLLGPGAPEVTHTVGESVAITEICDVVEIYSPIAVALSEKGTNELPSGAPSRHERCHQDARRHDLPRLHLGVCVWRFRDWIVSLY